VKPLSPSCFARAFPALAPQFTPFLILRGSAVKRFALLLREPSAGRAPQFTRSPNIAGLHAKARGCFAPGHPPTPMLYGKPGTLRQWNPTLDFVKDGAPENRDWDREENTGILHLRDAQDDGGETLPSS
jgi:hypothetical protein